MENIKRFNPGNIVRVMSAIVETLRLEMEDAIQEGDDFSELEVYSDG